MRWCTRGTMCVIAFTLARGMHSSLDMSDKLTIPEERKKSDGAGATEDEVNLKDTVPQRIDKDGTKVEDLAGTGEHDSSGG